MDNYYREKWMNDGQWECAKMFADVVGGFHHVYGTFKPCGYTGIKIHTYASRWATFDFDGLTRLVILGHNRMIRVECIPSGPRMVGFALYKRYKREGDMYERHPTIEEAIKRIRG